jgi:ABC-type dipeptide/oligopeptide/nickel transport system ATPase component
MLSIGVVDEPLSGKQEDRLDIRMHSSALTQYILTTRTPITVGVQGEWGSGKTSLINSIYQTLDDSPEIKQIWINSWEHSLLLSPEESLLRIVKRIIEELLDCDPDIGKRDSIKRGVESVFKGALRVGAFAVGGSGASNLAKELVGERQIGIGELRGQLVSLVKEIESRPSNPITKIVVYVDDLDRIEPKNAVSILELLKNIFSLPNCIFVLAIDYQVVVKGLEHKFGKQTAENEWEFRAFFDKIIQLPFMMPMGQYNIGRYVNSLLFEVGFTEGEGFDETSIKEIVLRSVGGNPRSIKRLINSVSLIKLFSEEKAKESITDKSDHIELPENKRQLMIFALVCLQIAYPYLYTVMNKDPNFPNWNEDTALRETQKHEENSKEFEKEFKSILDSGDDFDELWEQCLYRLCYLKPRLKARVGDISKFLSYIKDEILGKYQESIGDIVSEMMTQTSVTSVTSTDDSQVNFPVKEKYKTVRFDDFDQHKLYMLTEKKISENVVSDIEKMINHTRILFGDDVSATYAATEINLRKNSAKGRRKVFLSISFRKKKVIMQFPSNYHHLMDKYPEGVIDYFKYFKVEGLPPIDISHYDPLILASYEIL